MTNDEQAWSMILGGLIGAGIAAPKPEERQELQEYRNIKQQLILRQQRLGKLPDLPLLMSKPQFYNVFIEAYNTYLYGFFRSSSILCAVLIEALLKDKFGEGRFLDLIQKAKKDDVLSNAEMHYLHGLRIERNEFAHEVFTEVKEEDNLFILMVTIKLLNKLLNSKNG